MRHCHSRYAAGPGRPKWTAFAEALKGSSRIEAVRKFSHDGISNGGRRWTHLPGDASGSCDVVPDRTRYSGTNRDFVIGDRVFRRMKSTLAGTTVTISKKENGFAGWLAEGMPELMRV